MGKSRYVLCRPRGGLNDMLCQIGKCWSYALKHNRICIVDTEPSGLERPFSNYFELLPGQRKTLLNLEDSLLNDLDRSSVYPHVFKGRLKEYVAEWNMECRAYLDTISRKKSTFNFNKWYSSRTVLHHQCGGGYAGVAPLSRLRFTPSLISCISIELKKLPDSYVSVHVRNTDSKTDYKSFFSQIEGELGALPILVCSDDLSVIKYARGKWGDARVLTATTPPESSGKALHYPWELFSAQREQLNKNMFTDLVALASGERVLFCDTTSNNGAPSGFSLLADALWQDKGLLQSLLGMSN